jgi:lipoate-protein ligase B
MLKIIATMYTIFTTSEKKKQVLEKISMLEDEVIEALAKIDLKDLKKLAQMVNNNPSIVKFATKFAR